MSVTLKPVITTASSMGIRVKLRTSADDTKEVRLYERYYAFVIGLAAVIEEEVRLCCINKNCDDELEILSLSTLQTQLLRVKGGSHGQESSEFSH